jgi:hypothetical protein
MNLECLSGHENLEPDPRSGFAVSNLRASACPECDVVVWWDGSDRVPAWDGLTMGMGPARVIDHIPAVSAPSEEVVVCKTPIGFRLGWLPHHRWVEGAPGVFIARSGRHLLLSSPALDLDTLLNRGQMRHRRLAPVG